MKVIFAIWLCMLASPLKAEERSMLIGTWGDARQCAGDLVQPGGTVLAAPFEITEEWLKHRATWCRLNWFPTVARSNGVFVPSQALCGEDAGRSYRLDFVLQGGALRLIWDEALINGPLERCGA